VKLFQSLFDKELVVALIVGGFQMDPEGNNVS
jgi:hypothetical protein